MIADVYVTSPSLPGAVSGAGLDESLVEQVTGRNGIIGFDQLRGLTAFVGEDLVRVTGVSLAPGRGEARYPLKQGEATTAFGQLRDRGLVLISEPLARSGLRDYDGPHPAPGGFLREHPPRVSRLE